MGAHHHRPLRGEVRPSTSGPPANDWESGSERPPTRQAHTAARPAVRAVLDQSVAVDSFGLRDESRLEPARGALAGTRPNTLLCRDEREMGLFHVFYAAVRVCRRQRAVGWSQAMSRERSHRNPAPLADVNHGTRNNSTGRDTTACTRYRRCFGAVWASQRLRPWMPPRSFVSCCSFSSLNITGLPQVDLPDADAG